MIIKRFQSNRQGYNPRIENASKLNLYSGIIVGNTFFQSPILGTRPVLREKNPDVSKHTQPRLRIIKLQRR